MTVPVPAESASTKPTARQVQDAEAIVEPLDLVTGWGEALRDALVGDDDAASGCEAGAGGFERVDRMVHVVERLEDGDEVIGAAELLLAGVVQDWSDAVVKSSRAVMLVRARFMEVASTSIASTVTSG